jgi:hypothetical protein
MEERMVVGREGAPGTWRAVWAGLFVIAAVQILMQLFGIAIGVSALGPSRGALQGVGYWTGIWGIVSTLSAYFFGAWVAALVAPPLRPGGASVLAVVLWSFATTIGIALVAGGAFNLIEVMRLLLGGISPTSNAAVSVLHSGFSIGMAWATFGTILIALACAIAGAQMGAGSRELPGEQTRTTVVTPRQPIDQV